MAAPITDKGGHQMGTQRAQAGAQKRPAKGSLGEGPAPGPDRGLAPSSQK